MSDSHPHADTGEALSAHVRAETDHWLTKFPVDRKRSAVIAAEFRAHDAARGSEPAIGTYRA